MHRIGVWNGTVSNWGWVPRGIDRDRGFWIRGRMDGWTEFRIWDGIRLFGMAVLEAFLCGEKRTLYFAELPEAGDDPP